ncbi:hypothetical protein CRUP_012210 [Coryphaenoides rupestris]|nr:hypothetical protein CRUP_012210 [Coryphaenoides rupestris]
MQESLESLVGLLESYRGRDKIIRTICYGSQLVGGVLTERKTPPGGSSASSPSPALGQSLLLFSAQLSHCRTVLRLFDDLSMLAYSRSYGLGPEEADGGLRWISVLNNVADQLYYPCEHVAWASDAKLIRTPSDRCEAGSSSRSQLLRQMRGEVLTILSSVADLTNAIHWMPPGFMWAGQFPNWLVGLMGTISSVIGLIQMNTSNSGQ